ncbi:MAG TPA: DUF3667 domain-containing protein [Casimicrobiaceae bacterium]|nr:DUF3667 domain-containing protein [Casimicrobiaceae bacterium]
MNTLQDSTVPAFDCPSCGTESVGNFCSNCGERRLGSEDRSFRHYLDVVVDFLTHFDSKGYRSLRFLFTKPGYLSVEQLRGSRVRYAKPLSLFISINVVYYFSIALFGANTFTTPLSVQLHQNDYYPQLASRQVERRIGASKADFAAFEAKYNERTNVLSKTLIFLFIPIYATIFYAFFFRRRPYFVEHAIVATHLWSFVMALLAVAVPAIALAGMWWFKSTSVAAFLVANDNPITVFLQVCIAAYLALMLRRVYAANYGYCVAVALMIAWSFFHIVWLYRFFLFLITLHSI